MKLYWCHDYTILLWALAICFVLRTQCLARCSTCLSLILCSNARPHRYWFALNDTSLPSYYGLVDAAKLQEHKPALTALGALACIFGLGWWNLERFPRMNWGLVVHWLVYWKIDKSGCLGFSLSTSVWRFKVALAQSKTPWDSLNAGEGSLYDAGIESTSETVCQNWRRCMTEIMELWPISTVMSLEGQKKLELLMIIGWVRVTEIMRSLFSEESHHFQCELVALCGGLVKLSRYSCHAVYYTPVLEWFPGLGNRKQSREIAKPSSWFKSLHV